MQNLRPSNVKVIFSGHLAIVTIPVASGLFTSGENVIRTKMRMNWGEAKHLVGHVDWYALLEHRHGGLGVVDMQTRPRHATCGATRHMAVSALPHMAATCISVEPSFDRLDTFAWNLSTSISTIDVWPRWVARYSAVRPACTRPLVSVAAAAAAAAIGYTCSSCQCQCQLQIDRAHNRKAANALCAPVKRKKETFSGRGENCQRNVTDLAGSLVTSSRSPGRLQKRPDDRIWNAGVAVRTADGKIHDWWPSLLTTRPRCLERLVQSLGQTLRGK